MSCYVYELTSHGNFRQSILLRQLNDQLEYILAIDYTHNVICLIYDFIFGFLVILLCVDLFKITEKKGCVHAPE